jgi:starch synthase
LNSLLLHPGTQYSSHLASQLNRLGLLYRFITGLAFAPDDMTLKFMPDAVRKRLMNRILPRSIKPEQIQTIPLPELMSLSKLYLGGNMEDILYWRNKSFQEAIGLAALKPVDNVIGFDTSSWIIAEKCRILEKPFFLDQSIAHPRTKELIFKEVRKRYPNWSSAIAPKKEKNIVIEENEQRLSTKIVVASTFTKKSLIDSGIQAGKIEINPYGVGDEFMKPRNRNSGAGKVRFLYLGILGPRKGLPLLLEAWEELGLHRSAELWIAGPNNPMAEEAISKTPGAHYKGKLPFKQIPDLMSNCDCLVFPSFFEGFGLVILEAMASAMPVITTTATAGPDIIEHGIDGFVIQPGDKHALGAAMNLLAADKSLCHHMGTLAKEKAKLFSWNAYGDRWKNILYSN